MSFLNLIRSNRTVGAQSGQGAMSKEESLSVRLRLICTSDAGTPGKEGADD